MLPTTYTTRTDCIDQEIIIPLGEYVHDHDIDVIADELILTDEKGRYYIDPKKDFWQTVQNNIIHRTFHASISRDGLEIGTIDFSQEPDSIDEATENILSYLNENEDTENVELLREEKDPNEDISRYYLVSSKLDGDYTVTISEVTED